MKLGAIFSTILISATFALAQNTPRQSVDGTAFPDASPRGFNIKMAWLRNVFDDVPEHVGEGKAWAMASDADIVSRWKTMLDSNNVKYDGYDWATRDDYRASVVLFSLTDGRVTKLGLLVPELSKESLPAFLRPIVQMSSETIKPTGNAAAQSSASDGQPISLLIHGMHFTVTVSGSHQTVTHHEYHPRIGEPENGGPPDTVGTEPSFIEFETSPLDMWTFHNVSDPKIRGAIFAHRFVVGMRRSEAIAAKPAHTVAATDDSKNHLVWYEDTVKITGQTTFSDPTGTSVMSEYVPSRRTVAKADFVNDRLVKFTDTEDGSIQTLGN